MASGTSAATPFVSATAALLLVLNPNLTNTQVAQQIINNTDSLNGNAGWDKYTGYGRLNVYKTLSNAIGSSQLTNYVKTFNSPNPFYVDVDGYTNITLVSTQPEPADLTIYDTAGELVLHKAYDASQLNNNPSNPLPSWPQSDLDYDPVCFDIKSRKLGGDCRIVKIDHEEILCNYRVKVVSELAPSFYQLVQQTIELANRTPLLGPI